MTSIVQFDTLSLLYAPSEVIMSTAKKHETQVIALAILLLFFLQLLADFIEHIYVFGLLGTSIPPEIAAVLFLLAPALLLLRRRRLPPVTLSILTALIIIARLLEPLLDTPGRMLLSGLGVAAFLLLLPTLLQYQGKKDPEETMKVWGESAFLALFASVCLRTLGSGLDFSTVGWGQIIGWVLAIIASIAWFRQGNSAPTATSSPSNPSAQWRWGRMLLLSLGLTSVLLLFYFVFSAPHVLARWTGADYRWILGVLVVAWLLGAWLAEKNWLTTSHTHLFLLNLLLVLALAATARLHQVDFPPSPEAYPLLAPAPGWWTQIPLVLALLLSPLLFLDFALFTSDLAAARPPTRTLGLIFTISSLYFVVMIFAHVFTTVYDYIPLVGPWFRDQFWLVHLLVGMVIILALTAVRPRRITLSKATWRMVSLLGIVTVAGGVFINASPTPPSSLPHQLRIQTYNIQQGYSEDGRRNFAGQLALLQEIDADIIGLQESDNARIAGGNADIVRYLSNALSLYSYYGPKTVTGTFGIALLSKYPIHNPKTYFLYSEGEQVAVISAEIRIGDQLLHVFVTHLGNGGPLIQQQQFLQLVQDEDHVIAMGDFNFCPNEEQYRLTTRFLQDTWTRKWPDWQDDRGQRPVDKIDHIWVSPDLTVLDAQFIDSPASDHPTVTATIAW